MSTELILKGAFLGLTVLFLFRYVYIRGVKAGIKFAVHKNKDLSKTLQAFMNILEKQEKKDNN